MSCPRPVAGIVNSSVVQEIGRAVERSEASKIESLEDQVGLPDSA